MYRRLHPANYSLLRIRDLSGRRRHRCTPQEQLTWGWGDGGGTCLFQIELSTSQVFLVCVFQFRKLIPSFLLPVCSRLLCTDGREKEMMDFSVTSRAGLGFVSDGCWVIGGELDRCFIGSVYLSPVSFYHFNH